MKSIKNKQKGFTLVELLVVLAIIGLLAAIGIPMILNVQRASRNTTKLKQLEPVNGSATDYYTKYNSDPTVVVDTTDTTKVNVGSGSRLIPVQSNGGFTYLITTTCGTTAGTNMSANSQVVFRTDITNGLIYLCKEGGGEDQMRFKQ